MTQLPARRYDRAQNRPRRRKGTIASVLLLVIAGAIAGAAVGAALRATPANRHIAEAIVFVRGEDQDEELRHLKAVFELPQVGELARASASAPVGFRPEVEVDERPAIQAVVVRVRESSPERAVIFADTVVAQGLAYDDATRALQGEPLNLGDFESGTEAWNLGQRALTSPPDELRVVVGDARFNGASLSALCTAEDTCGPSRFVQYPFRAGVRYRFAAWVRGDGGARATFVAGSAEDTAESAEVPLSSAWRRLVLDWIPVTDYAVAEIAIVTSSDQSETQIDLDGVWMADGSAFQSVGRPLPTGAAETLIFASANRPAAIPAVVAGETSSRTVEAALLGALVGLGAVSLLIALALLSRRRS